MRFIEVEQIRNPIRRHSSQRGTLKGLGLGRIGRIKWVPDTPSNRGMIKNVSHLVQINHDPAAPKPSRNPRCQLLRRAGLDCDAALWLRGTEARAQPAERVAHPDKECGKEKVGQARRQPLNCTRGGSAPAKTAF
jgi:large subunit ribosomal protein L30